MIVGVVLSQVTEIDGRDLHSFWRSTLLGLDTQLSSTAGLNCSFGTTMGLLKQIPPVARTELVVAGFSTAGVDVRGGFVTDIDTGVKLLVTAEDEETTGTSLHCITLPFIQDSLTLGDHLIPSCSRVCSDISCSAR